MIRWTTRRNCYDNAMVLRRENSPPDCFLVLPTFFKALKSVLVWRTVFLTREDASAAIARYIDGFHNPIRRHSALGYRSPLGRTSSQMTTVCLSTFRGKSIPISHMGLAMPNTRPSCSASVSSDSGSRCVFSR